MGHKHCAVVENENLPDIIRSVTKDIEICNRATEKVFLSNSSNCLNLDERIDENKTVKKIKLKEKVYTIKTIIDRHVGTDWVNSRIFSNVVPSQDSIESQIAVILSGCNLNAITLRKLYALLSICFNINLLNTDIQNIYQVIRENLLKLRKTNNQEVKKNKKNRDKKRTQIKGSTKFNGVDDTNPTNSSEITTDQHCEENNFIDQT